MKAFKLASAFAITGLALAVSGQAMAADTTTDWTWDGKVVFSADLMNTTNGGSVGSRGANGDSTANIDVDIAVANGGFSGMFKIDSSDAHDEISISGVRYDEGAISFGDIGSMNTTEGYIASMKDDLNYGVDNAFRYTMGNGLAVQAQGGVTYTDSSTSVPVLGSDMGVAVAYAGEFEGGSFAVDVEYAEDGTSAADAALDMYTGFGVTVAASDAVTVMAAYTAGIAGVSSMGVRADYAGDAFNAYGEWVDEVITVGADATMGMANVYVDYTVDGDQNAGVKLAGAADALTWGANFDYAINDTAFSYGVNASMDAGTVVYAAGYMSREGQASSELTASATHTTEGGAVLSLAYEKDDGTSTDPDSSKAAFNALTVTASYSF